MTDSKADASHGMRILAKAREYEGDVVNQHFFWMQYIQTRYKQRTEDPAALDDVIDACEKMIALAPRVREEMQREHDQAETRAVERGLASKRERFPGVPPRHVGFERLIVIRKKQKDEAQRLQESYEREWKAHSLDAGEVGSRCHAQVICTRQSVRLDICRGHATTLNEPVRLRHGIRRKPTRSERAPARLDRTPSRAARPLVGHASRLLGARTADPRF